MAGIALLFLLIFVFGFWLQRSGKPYSGLIFNLHKLIALGTGVFLVVTLIQYNQAVAFSPGLWAAIIITALCFAVVVASGGMLSLARPTPLIVQRLHQVGPFLALISAGVMLYLVLRA